jgi:glycosyltransferase involved in cell wall biosynthesis
MIPFISIIIPCRNEEKFIGKCLNSIIFQDYPKEKTEVLVVDGMSEDGTRAIVKNYSGKYPFIKLLDNPDKFTSFALNIGIKNSGGEIIARMDAHAGYEKDYISKCVKYLKEYGADNIGGIMKTLPRKKTIIAKAIAVCLSHPFGAGGSQFRMGTNEPKWVDTVFNGCYKKEVFEKIGLFNENLIRTQDMEFNLRLKKAGGKILMHPAIVSYYYPKDNLKDFFLHNFKDGIWAILPLKFVKIPLRLRHYIPLVFVLTLPLNIWLYILVSLFFSFKIAVKEKDLRYFFAMPIVFFCRHIGYGFGSLFGLFELFFRK